MENPVERARDLLIGLAEGRVSREEAAGWAMKRIREDTTGDAADPMLWAALDRLAGADLQQGPGVYLHGDDDFRAWLADLR